MAYQLEPASSRSPEQRALESQAYKIHFDLAGSRYTFISKLGIGAYGIVCTAAVGGTQQKVAIKKVSRIFDNLELAKRTYREIKILRQLAHPNIISVKDIHIPSTSDFSNFQDIYIIFDLLYSDLHKLLHTSLFKQLTLDHIRYLLCQALSGLNYLHSANVIHRDIKPSNLFVNPDCTLRIGDFGMARGVTHDVLSHRVFMTQYVATRWYRAPEIMFSFIEYTRAVDMWSVGCVFVEMLTGKYLFPGQNPFDQLKQIIRLLGTPSERFLARSQSELVRNLIRSLPRKPPVSLPQLLPDKPPEAIDLVAQLLTLDPAMRVTAAEALAHPFFIPINGELAAKNIRLQALDFTFEESLRLPKAELLRQKLSAEISDVRRTTTTAAGSRAGGKHASSRTRELLKEKLLEAKRRQGAETLVKMEEVSPPVKMEQGDPETARRWGDMGLRDTEQSALQSADLRELEEVTKHFSPNTLNNIEQELEFGVGHYAMQE